MLQHPRSKQPNLVSTVARLVSGLRFIFLPFPAGFTFAYNARLYFLTYYPDCDVGAWLSWVSILGGSVGVVAGGTISDKITQTLGLSARLWVLGGSMVRNTTDAFSPIMVCPHNDNKNASGLIAAFSLSFCRGRSLLGPSILVHHANRVLSFW